MEGADRIQEEACASDELIPIGGGLFISFTQEVHVQVGGLSFTTCFATCVADGRDSNTLLGLCMYPSRPLGLRLTLSRPNPL